MKDLLRIHVLWSPAQENDDGRQTANLIASHFDGLGMERDGVAFRVPVRFYSEPWEAGSPQPRQIDFDLAEHNAIVLLHDTFMHADRNSWVGYLTDIKDKISERGDVDIYIPFGSPLGEHPLPCDGDIQYARRDKWVTALPSKEERDVRLLVHIVFAIRRHLKELGQAAAVEKLFVSHAKLDGDDTAKHIVDYVNGTTQDVPLQTFYDAKELVPGTKFRKTFEREIQNGTLLAIVSDVYDSRPWCIFELTTAKRHLRPIVLADVGRTRTSRTYPYGANVPKIRVSRDSNNWIEPLILQTLSEGLRCDLILERGNILKRDNKLPSDALVLPRPAELFDLVDLAKLPSVIVYPDPPLGNLEADILDTALRVISPNSSLSTLSEVR